MLECLEGINSLAYGNLGDTASTIAPTPSFPSPIISITLRLLLSHLLRINLIKHLISFLMCHISPSLSSIRLNILLLEKHSISPNSNASDITAAGYSINFSTSILNTAIFSIIRFHPLTRFPLMFGCILPTTRAIWLLSSFNNIRFKAH